MKNLTYVQKNRIDVEYEAWNIGHSIRWEKRDEAVKAIVNALNSENDQNELFGLDNEYTIEMCLDEFLSTNPEWFHDDAAEEEAYRTENEPKVREMFQKYFEGKTWDEIRNDEFLYEMWGSYSDYHKDVFGYRPHDIVCGTYVSPY